MMNLPSDLMTIEKKLLPLRVIYIFISKLCQVGIVAGLKYNLDTLVIVLTYSFFLLLLIINVFSQLVISMWWLDFSFFLFLTDFRYLKTIFQIFFARRFLCMSRVWGPLFFCLTVQTSNFLSFQHHFFVFLIKFQFLARSIIRDIRIIVINLLLSAEDHP